MRVLIALFATLSLSAGDVQLSEYAAKAAFISKFLGYVKWPESAFAEPTSPLRIAVLGDDPFGKPLDDLFADKRYGAHPIEIVRFERIVDIETCHVLFVPVDESDGLEKVLERIQRKPVLLIGEHKGFAASGGCINFVLEDKKIRFEINTDATRRASLEISSQLLKLAKVVKDAKSEGDL